MTQVIKQLTDLTEFSDFVSGEYVWYANALPFDIFDLINLQIDSQPELDELMFRYHKASHEQSEEAQRQVRMPSSERNEVCSFEESIWGQYNLDKPDYVAFWKSHPQDCTRTRPELDAKYATLCHATNSAHDALVHWFRDHIDELYISVKDE